METLLIIITAQPWFLHHSSFGMWFAALSRPLQTWKVFPRWGKAAQLHKHSFPAPHGSSVPLQMLKGNPD